LDYLFENIYYILIFYLIMINLVNLALFAIDKKRARFKKWRVSEMTFFLISLLGGSIGGLIGMNIFRHKTKKISFRILLPVFLILNFICIVYLLNYIEGLGIESSPGLQLF